MLHLFNDRSPIGPYLQRTRIELGKSLEEIAAGTGYSTDRIEQIETWTLDRGLSAVPLVDGVEAIARGLDTSLTDLVRMAQADGLPSVTMGKPPRRDLREIVPTLIHVSTRRPSAVPIDPEPAPES